MIAREYQTVAKVALERHFEDVRLEWPVVKDATDVFARDDARYAPRVDIAVGPFSLSPGVSPAIRAASLPPPMGQLFEGCTPNPNPRCLIAIEVSFSGTSKHVMGDMLNASALGRFGLVIGNERQIVKISRILAYLDVLAGLGKTPRLLENLVALRDVEFDAVLAQEL